MKITTIIPDKLLDEVKKFSGGGDVTESIIIALEDFAARQRISKVIKKIKRQPLSFREGYSASKVRKLNRQL